MKVKFEWILAGIIALLIVIAISKNFGVKFGQISTSEKCWVDIPCSNYDECKTKLGFTDQLLKEYQVVCEKEVCKAFVECGTEKVGK
jgi:hypothetical protein